MLFGGLLKRFVKLLNGNDCNFRPIGLFEDVEVRVVGVKNDASHSRKGYAYAPCPILQWSAR